MQLHGKSAVIYGAHSPTGTSIARALAKEGATVYLAGRSVSKLEPIARQILDAGGAAKVAVVDPLDPSSVSEHLHEVGVEHGSLDLSVNVAFLGRETPVRFCNLTDEQFTTAALMRVRSNFVTMAAAARVMALQGRGVVLGTAAPAPSSPVAEVSAQSVGDAAVQALGEQLRGDVGSFGVRFAYLDDVPASEEPLVEALLRVLEAVPTASASDIPLDMASAEAGGFRRDGVPAGAGIS